MTNDYPDWLDEPDREFRRIKHTKQQRERRRARGALPRAVYEIKPWEFFGKSRRTYFRSTTPARRRKDRLTIVAHLRAQKWHTCEPHIISDCKAAEIPQGLPGEQVAWTEAIKGIPPEWLIQRAQENIKAADDLIGLPTGQQSLALWS